MDTFDTIFDIGTRCPIAQIDFNITFSKIKKSTIHVDHDHTVRLLKDPWPFKKNFYS